MLTQLTERGTHPGMWTLPGGGLDHGEDPRAGVRREVYEETGLTVTPGRLLDSTPGTTTALLPMGV